MPADINEYNEVKECLYNNEHYSVRDNGAVLRHGRKNKPLRKYDNQWTFGTINNYGYLLIATEVVHRIVATAFIGEPPTNQYIVDHIDTNRQNNRPENLRWLTRLENILNNPITVKKIEFLCGSIDTFLKDPSILKLYENQDRNFAWMRAVSPEEARASWERINKWTKTKSNNISLRSGSLGEWIFTPVKKTEKERIEDEQKQSLVIPGEIEKVLQKVEKDTGLTRDKFSSKTKKKEYLNARVYAAILLRLEIGLSEESISKLIGISKSMVNTYLNHTDAFLRNVDYYRSNSPK